MKYVFELDYYVMYILLHVIVYGFPQKNNVHGQYLHDRFQTIWLNETYVGRAMVGPEQ